MLMKKILFALAIVLSVVVSSCNCDDYPPTPTPPPVEVRPSTLTGRIVDATGKPMVGAKVTFGDQTTTTNSDGVYEFGDLSKQGAAKLSASAEGYVTAHGEVIVPDVTKASYTLTWGAVLYLDVKAVAVPQPDETSAAEVVTENVPNNEQGEVKIDVEVPADAVEVPAGGEQVEITLRPLYSNSDAQEQTMTRAAYSDQIFLVGATLTCNRNDVQVNKPVTLTLELDQSCQGVAIPRMYTGGKWVDLKEGKGVNQYQFTSTGLVIKAKNFTSYGVFAPVQINTSMISNPITITPQAEFDNFYGTKDMKVTSVDYVAKLGVDLNAAQAKNKLQGLLIEYLARQYGAVVSELKGTLNIDVLLPPGCRLFVDGSQDAEKVTVKAGTTSVTSSVFGEVRLGTRIELRGHNGGGSN